MEMLQINEKRLHVKEKGNVEMLQTNEEESVESPELRVTSPVIMTIYSGSINGIDTSILAANLAAYIGERHFPVLLVDLDLGGVSSRLHGVEFSYDELGIFDVFAAYDTYAVILVASGDAPTVKPSAKAKGVYVMPPGNAVTAVELIKKKVDYMNAEMLRSLVIRQAEKYRTPLVIIDTPPELYISDFMLSFSDMAAVVLASSPVGVSREFEIVMKRIGGYLSNMNAVFIVIMKEVWSVGGYINAPFPLYRLPFSPEVEVCSRHNLIFITTEPKTDSGRRWRAEFVRFAEAVAEKAKEILRNKAYKKQEKSAD